MASLSRKQLDLFSITLANITAPSMVIWMRYTHAISTAMAVFAGVLSLLIINLALFLGIRARNKRSWQVRSRKWHVAVLVLGLIWPVYSSLRKASVPSGIELLDLARSGKPLSEIRPEQSRLVVEFLRLSLANERAYRQTAAAVKPFSPPLYSPASFANKTVCTETLGHLKDVVKFDFEYLDRQQQANREFRAKMIRVDPGSDLLKTGDEMLAPAVAVNAIETQWLAETVSLYDYAASHELELALRNDVLQFSADNVRQEFTRRLAAAKDLFTKLQARVQDSNKQQKQAKAGATENPER